MIESVSDDKRKRPNRSVALDRLPPHSIEAEQGVLGCALLDPNTCLPTTVEKIRGDKLAFYDLRHQTIWETLVTMFEKRNEIDLITVQQHLKDRQLLDQIGGIAYLSQMQDAVPSAANVSYYLDIVKEKHLLRTFITTCTGVVGKIYDHEGSVDELLDEAEKSVMKVHELRTETSKLEVRELVNAALLKIESAFNKEGKPTGITTGFADFDKMTDGLHGSEMIIIAARPSMGKTSLVMNIVEHIALDQKLPVGVFSLEMSAESLVHRSIGSVGRINVRQPNNWDHGDFQKATVAAAKLSNASHLIRIDDTGGLTILELRAKARRMVQEFGVKAFVIDYLQLLSGVSKKAKENRQVEVSEISSGIKALAKELRVPIIVLSQLNRELEKNKRKPRLSDLRESGSIEQDGDLIAFLSKVETDEDDESSDLATPVILDIAKQRNGPTGEVRLTFLKPYTRFESAAKISYED